ncbi:hypothetical protein [Pseudomonas monsensis]
MKRDVEMSGALLQQLEERSPTSSIIRQSTSSEALPQWAQLAGHDPELHGPPGIGRILTTKAFAASLSKKIMLVSIANLESKFMGVEVERRSQIRLIFGDKPLRTIAFTAPKYKISIPVCTPQVKPNCQKHRKFI